MMLDEPNIPLLALEASPHPRSSSRAITTPSRDEHTLDIFHHLPNSQLAIFPNATHMIPFDDPALFNATVERFLRTPFVKRDRIATCSSPWKSSARSSPGTALRRGRRP